MVPGRAPLSGESGVPSVARPPGLAPDPRLCGPVSRRVCSCRVTSTVTASPYPRVGARLYPPWWVRGAGSKVPRPVRDTKVPACAVGWRGDMCAIGVRRIVPTFEQESRLIARHDADTSSAPMLAARSRSPASMPARGNSVQISGQCPCSRPADQHPCELVSIAIADAAGHGAVRVRPAGHLDG